VVVQEVLVQELSMRIWVRRQRMWTLLRVLNLSKARGLAFERQLRIPPEQ
jgi:hypothetical protein